MNNRCPLCGVQPRTENGLDFSRPVDNTDPAAAVPDGVELIPVTGRNPHRLSTIERPLGGVACPM